MLKSMIKIIAVIAVVIMSVWAFLHLLPWVIAILTLAALVIKLYHIWIRRNGGTPPAWWGLGGKEA